MSEHDHNQRLEDLLLTRRQLLARMGNGFAGLGLAGLLAGEAQSASAVPKTAHAVNPLTVKQPPLPAKAKRVIFLFMNGGPSHVDTFDPKPMLTKYHGQALPYSNLPTERKTGTAFRAPFEFKKCGQSGIEVSDIFPHIGSIADEITLLKAVQTEVFNHGPAKLFVNTGVQTFFDFIVTYSDLRGTVVLARSP